MNQSISLNTVLYNIKNAFWIVCILALTFGIPVLSYLEFTQVEQEPKTEIVKQETAAKQTRTISVPKYFKI